MKRHPGTLRRVLSIVLAAAMLAAFGSAAQAVRLPSSGGDAEIIVKASDEAPQISFTAPEAIWLKQAPEEAEVLWGFANLDDPNGAGLAESAAVEFTGKGANVISITGTIDGKTFTTRNGLAKLNLLKGGKLPTAIPAGSFGILEWEAVFTLDGYDGEFTAKTYTVVYAPSDLGTGTIGAARGVCSGSEVVNIASIIGIVGLHGVSNAGTSSGTVSAGQSSIRIPNGAFKSDFINMEFKAPDPGNDVEKQQEQYANGTVGNSSIQMVVRYRSSLGTSAISASIATNNSAQAANNYIIVDRSRFTDLNQVYGLKGAFRLTRQTTGDKIQFPNPPGIRFSIDTALNTGTTAANPHIVVPAPYNVVTAWQSTKNPDALVSDGWNRPITTAASQTVTLRGHHAATHADNASNSKQEITHTTAFTIQAVDKSALRNGVLMASLNRLPDQMLSDAAAYNAALKGAVERLGNPANSDVTVPSMPEMSKSTVTLTLEGYADGAAAAAGTSPVDLGGAYSGSNNVLSAPFSTGDTIELYAPKLMGWEPYAPGQLTGATPIAGFDSDQWVEAGAVENAAGNLSFTVKYVPSDEALATLAPYEGVLLSVSSLPVTFGQPYAGLPTPTRRGYTFDGWYTAAQGAASGPFLDGDEVTVKGNHTLYMRWAPVPITVTFDLNGGGEAPFDTASVAYAAAYGTLPSPTRAGHIFSGWYTAAEGGTRVMNTTKVSTEADHSIYARWTAVPGITVQFNSLGGEEANPMEVQYMEPYGTLPTVTRRGYDSFAGWYIDETTQITESSIVTATVGHTLFAAWADPSESTLHFDTMVDGLSASPAAKDVVFDEAYGALPALSREGYVFEGWFTAAQGGEKITAEGIVDIIEDQTLYAQWRAVSPVTVSFDLQGGTANSAVEPIEAAYLAAYGTLPDAAALGFAHPGYSSFAGWYSAATGGSEITAASVVSNTENHSLYARWAGPVSVLVSFDSTVDGLTPSPTSTTVSFAAAYGTLPELSRPGHVFAGWYTAAEGGTKITAESILSDPADHTLYARWTLLPAITLRFDSRGGAAVDPIDVVYLTPYGTLPVPTRKGYQTFLGWFSSIMVGTVPVSELDIVNKTEEHTLYARWADPVTSTVSFDTTVADMTASPASKTVTFDAAYGPLPLLTRERYVFLGWYTAAAGGSKITEDTMVDIIEAQTLYAQWAEAETITVSFDLQGGTANAAVDSIAVEYQRAYGTLPDAAALGLACEGYSSFAGWYTAPTGGSQVTEATLVTTAEDHTLYARWSGGAAGVVTFDAAPGAITTGAGAATFKNVSYGAAYGTLPTPAYEGYTFLGWFTPEGSLVTAASPVAILGDHQLTARWSAKSVSVSYHVNGGNALNPTAKLVTPGTAYGTLPTPTRSGHRFDGWYTALTGGTKITEDSIVEIIGAHVIYARWAEDDTPGGEEAPRLTGSSSLSLDYLGSANIASYVAGESLRWSSNSAAVTVDQQGNITSHKAFWKPGMSAVITAENKEGKVELQVNVKLSFVQWLITILLFGWIWY